MSEHQERRGFNLQMAQDIGEIKGLLEGLAGPQGRVTKLEDHQGRQWWFTIGIAPLLAIAHGLARKLGVNI